MPAESLTAPLIRTKLQPPRLPADLVRRRRLLDRLHAGLDRKLTIISAMAGAGKTTLLAQWLEECERPCAWISLDERDNHRLVFLSYLCAAVRTVYPAACAGSLSMLSQSEVPPGRVLTALIVNELGELAAEAQGSDVQSPGLVIVLDDYHVIADSEVQELVSGIVDHLPRGVHLALATRVDPRLPLARLRACREMTEVRFRDLRFTSEEAQSLLAAATDSELDSETVRELEARTEGWVVGLRLAALALRGSLGDGVRVEGLGGTNSTLVADYLLDEVLAKQAPDVRDFALCSSVVDRFCASLCEALTGLSASASQEIIDWASRANLFLIDLDHEGVWYRFHHLFRDLLRHELRSRYGAPEVRSLHSRAGAWFEERGLVEESLHHFHAAGDGSAAAAVIARDRYDLMNRARWGQAERYLAEFTADEIARYPELLLLRAWLLYYGSRYSEIPATIGDLEAALDHASLGSEDSERLEGELSALRAIVSYHSLDAEGTLRQAGTALAKTPHELWIVRVMLRMFQGGARLLLGDRSGAYRAVYASLSEEGDGSNPFRATVLTTACHVHWVTGDLAGLEQAAQQVLSLSQDPYSPQFSAYGHYNIGRVRYHLDDLPTAEHHLRAVVTQPYLSYGSCYINSACGLALTYQAQGRPVEAREVLEAAVAYSLETGNSSTLPMALAFQAELALMQGDIAAAGQWARRLDPTVALSPGYWFFSEQLTLVKVWLAQDTPESRRHAADLLGRVVAFCESSHSTRFLIEALTLRALLHDAEGSRSKANAALDQAVSLAEPGGFIRLFVDLGPRLAPLLVRLRGRTTARSYLARVLAACWAGGPDTGLAAAPPLPLVEPLTPRELEILSLLARRLTNKEIAQELVIAPSTVKTHTLNIYGKLDVRKRRQAVERAMELGILQPPPYLP